MALTTHAGKGSELTWAEGDANFTGLADGSLITVDRTATGSVATTLPSWIETQSLTIEDFGGGVSKTAAQNDAAIALAITALPARGGTLVFSSAGKYLVSATITLTDKKNFRITGAAPSDGGGADTGTRIAWNGTAAGTVFLIDACRDWVIQDLQVASGTADYGVAFDWDKISGTGTSTNGTWKRVLAYIPSAGIGWRVSNIADANHEAGRWINCYAIGPGTALSGGISAGTGGTSIGVQVRGVNAHALLWFSGGTSLLNVTFDINDNIATKSFPGGSLNVIENNGGYCDVYYQVGRYTRWPILISGGSCEFASQLFAGADLNNSEAGIVTIEKLRCAVHATPTVPFIRHRNQGILNLHCNNFDADGYNATFQIKVGVGGSGADTGLVSIGNVYPNTTPWDTAAGRIFTVKSIGDKANYNDGSNAKALPDIFGGYGAFLTKPLTVLGIPIAADVGTVTSASVYLGTDTSTGIYRSAANEMAFTVLGTRVGLWSANGFQPDIPSSGNVRGICAGTTGGYALYTGTTKLMEFRRAGGSGELIQLMGTNAATTGMSIGGAAASSVQNIDFYTDATIKQFNITHTSSATRYITVTGSNGGNPTISVSAGRLNVGSALTLSSLGAFAASDKYLIVDSSGNVHVSALGPAS